LYVRYGERASTKLFNWSSTSNIIEIQPNDPNFHREGYYYILVHAVTSIWNKFADDTFGYNIVYTTQNGY